MAVIDWDQFIENFQYYDRETIVEVIENFFDEYEERVRTIEKNIAENDLRQLSFNAHSLKSVIGNFMAPEPYELCRQIEELAKQNLKNEIPDLFSKLKKLIDELIAELREYLQK